MMTVRSPQMIGNSLMPPYWALGFHQSHYGLKNVSMVERTVNEMIKANIPLEVMYTDIDYMNLWCVPVRRAAKVSP
jgi:alpha-glucosidase